MDFVMHALDAREIIELDFSAPAAARLRRSNGRPRAGTTPWLCHTDRGGASLGGGSAASLPRSEHRPPQTRSAIVCTGHDHDSQPADLRQSDKRQRQERPCMRAQYSRSPSAIPGGAKGIPSLYHPVRAEYITHETM